MCTKYKKYRNKLTHNEEILKENYYRNLFCENNDPSLTWKHMNEILINSKNEVFLPNFLKMKEKEITEPQNICNELNQHFVDIGKKIITLAILTEINVSIYVIWVNINLLQLFSYQLMNTKWSEALEN